jgi:hypothetical protein
VRLAREGVAEVAPDPSQFETSPIANQEISHADDGSASVDGHAVNVEGAVDQHRRWTSYGVSITAGQGHVMREGEAHMRSLRSGFGERRIVQRVQYIHRTVPFWVTVPSGGVREEPIAVQANRTTEFQRAGEICIWPRCWANNMERHAASGLCESDDRR